MPPYLSRLNILATINFGGIVTDLEESLRSEVDIEDISTRGVELLVERERPRI